MCHGDRLDREARAHVGFDRVANHFLATRVDGRRQAKPSLAGRQTEDGTSFSPDIAAAMPALKIRYRACVYTIVGGLAYAAKRS